MNALRSRAIVVILILGLILAWLVLDQARGANPIRDAFSGIVSPLQFVLQRLTGPVSHTINGLVTLGSLQGQNQALRQENAALRSEILLLREAQRENEVLRRELKYKSSVPTFRLLSAEVIGRDPSNLSRYLIVDRGAEDGVERAMPVLTAEGLVGRISEVSRNSAKVMMITDSGSEVAALIQRSRATGLVRGYPGGYLVMRYIPQGDTVAPGDFVLTSGLGGNLPRRLVIGQVTKVSQKDVEMFQQAEVVPAVNLNGLESIMILLNFSQAEADRGDGSN